MSEPAPFVLIVEDDPISARVLSKIAEKGGYRYTAIADPHQALRMIAGEPPDVALLDVSMPGLDGYEVCRRIKADSRTADVPVIFISGLDETLDKVRGFNAGGADYVTKPYRYEEVLARIEHQLRISRLQRLADQRNRELLAANEELARANEELARKHEDLMQSQRRLEQVFTALTEVLPGTLLDDKYQLEELIGSGGFGSVYRARHLLMERNVAVKVLQPVGGEAREQSLDRFRREAISACRFDHPNAVTVLDASISSSGIPYLVMELLSGRSFADELRSEGSVALARATEVLSPVCEVLARAHAAGLAHRDVKPENIFLHQHEGREVVKVLDFGLSMLQQHEQSGEASARTSTVYGTPLYMAPELFRGEQNIDARPADVYALGVILFESLTGRHVFAESAGGFEKIAAAHFRETPRSIREFAPEAPAGIETVIRCALEKEPQRRCSATEFAERLILAVAALDPDSTATRARFSRTARTEKLS